ncbi:MAG: prepilin-type N-terminal cleavage/methylation domain-containing protein [Patescibacteria group bacterium]|nr:prepilin-type N-terminal cleavage/methylation domain-containing protein [Patescibacteria group bacterium]
MKSFKKGRNKGFTLIEVMIVFAIIALIALIGISLGIDNYRYYLLTTEIKNFISIMRSAKWAALSNNYKQSYGLSLQLDKFVIFQGSTYATRNTIFDEVYPRNQSINVTGPSEVVFSPLSATPNATGTFVFSNSIVSRMITINSHGAIFW